MLQIWGLDIFQRYEMGPFSLPDRIQEKRLQAFEVTYLRQDPLEQT